MPGQIVNVSNDQAIAEVALKCGDPFFKDFPKNIYSQAVYRGTREIAKEYGIMDRSWSYTNTGGTSPFAISPLNFTGAWRCSVLPSGDTAEIIYTEVKLDSVLDNDTSDTAITNYYYSIIYDANQYMFYYTHPAEDDVVTIYYVSSVAGEEDYEVYDENGDPNAIPVLPNKYFEELIRRAVRYMAKLGIATFDDRKAEKYGRVLQLHTKRTDEKQDMSLERSRPWIEIQPFIYP
jgi:hypothetical protein